MISYINYYRIQCNLDSIIEYKPTWPDARTALHTNFRATRDITYSIDHSTYTTT